MNKRKTHAVVDLTVVKEEDEAPLKKKRGRPPKQKREERKIEVPGHLICNISREMLRHPVTTDAGHAYERSRIFEWFKNQKDLGRTLRDPVSNEVVSDK